MSAGAQPTWKPPDTDRQPQAWTPPASDRGAESPSYLSQVGAGLWNTVKGLAQVGSEAGQLAGDPLHAISHLKALKQLVLDPQVDQAIEAAHKWQSGDHSEAVGHALAAILPGVGPAAANIGEKAGTGDLKGAAADATTLGVTMAAPHIASAVADVAPRAAGAVAAGAKAAAPDVAAGAGKVAAGAIASEMLPGGPLKYVAGAAPVYAGARQIGRGLSKGFDAGKAALSDRVASAVESLTKTPGQALAETQGADWTKLSADDKATMELVAKAQQNAAAQPPAAPRPTAPAASQPEPQAPASQAPQTLAEMIQAEIAAPKSTARPPLRPPLAEPAPLPPESAIVPPANSPRVPLRPPVGPAPPQSLAEAVAPLPDHTQPPASAPPRLGLAAFGGDSAHALLNSFSTRYPNLTTNAGVDRLLSLAQKISKADGGAPALRHLGEAMQYESAAADSGISSGSELLEHLAAGMDPTAENVFTDSPFRGGKVLGSERARQIIGESPVPPRAASESIARTLPQVESAMAQKAPAPTEAPTSQYTATGERKSPALRGAEITGANTAAKVTRWVQAMHDAGVTSAEFRSIPVGRLSPSQIESGGMPGLGNITDDLVAKGVFKAGETPPNTSIPNIINGLKKLEAQKIAAALAEEMKRSGTIQ